MKTNYYFLKLHYDILDDWKVGTLPDSLKWRFIQCLCVAGECQEDGLLPELNHFAYRIRQEPTALNSDMARLASNELVELVQLENGTERWFVTNYMKRQEKISDAQRQRDYRARNRQPVTTPLPDNNDSVTTALRYVTQNRIEENKNRVESDVDVERKTHAYQGHIENDNLQKATAEIAAVVKDTLAPGFNEDRFESAAQAIIALDAVDRIAGFAEWWQRNSYYSDNGKPALKTFIMEFKNYLDGVERKSNGQTKPEEDPEYNKPLSGSW